jgi:hypothetical protein
MNSTSTITLSCLTALASHMSCSQLSHHVDDHFSINENYVPLDFLTLVTDALDQSYPGTATLGELSKEDAVSSAVYGLLTTLREKFEVLPVEFALQAFEAVREGLSTWLSDPNKVVHQDDAPGVSHFPLEGEVGLTNRSTSSTSPSWACLNEVSKQVYSPSLPMDSIKSSISSLRGYHELYQELCPRRSSGSGSTLAISSTQTFQKKLGLSSRRLWLLLLVLSKSRT